MADRYDEVEQRMGICAYASPENEGFAAVLKARYSDFCVHEGMRMVDCSFLVLLVLLPLLQVINPPFYNSAHEV